MIKNIELISLRCIIDEAKEVNTMKQTEIRDFLPEDEATYMRLSEEFYHSKAVLYPVPHENFVATFTACMQKSPFLRGLAILQNGEMAGYALLSFTWSNEVAGLVVLLEEAYIVPAFQGSGLGGELLQFVEEEYKSTAKRIRLEVTALNEGAVRLYERHGYKMFDYLQMVKEL